MCLKDGLEEQQHKKWWDLAARIGESSVLLQKSASVDGFHWLLIAFWAMQHTWHTSHWGWSPGHAKHHCAASIDVTHTVSEWQNRMKNGNLFQQFRVWTVSESIGIPWTLNLSKKDKLAHGWLVVEVGRTLVTLTKEWNLTRFMTPIGKISKSNLQNQKSSDGQYKSILVIFGWAKVKYWQLFQLHVSQC